MEENVIQINGKCLCECKKRHVCEKDYGLDPATCNCEKKLASVMDDSAIICVEVIASYNEEISTIPTNFNEKKVTCKKQNFYILLAFVSITIALLIAISIYYYLTEYRAKQLLPFHYTNDELREVIYY